MTKKVDDLFFWTITLILAGAFALLMFTPYIHAAPTTQPTALAPIVAAAAPNAVLDLPLGKYFTTAILFVDKPGVHVRAAIGSTLTIPLAGAGIIARQPNCTFDGFTIPAGNVVFNPWADNFTIANCQIGLGSPQAVQQAIKTGPGGTNCHVVNSHIGITATVGFYGDRGGETGLNTVFDGSQREYCLRLETPDNGVTIPVGASFTGCTFNSIGGKDSVGVRNHKNVSFLNCTITGNDIRWGQGNQPPTTKPGQFASGTLTNCTCKNIVGKSDISVDQGASVVVTGCQFLEPTAPPIAADSFSLTTYGNNVQHITVGTQPFVFYSTVAGKGQSVYTGGDTVLIDPQPTK